MIHYRALMLEKPNDTDRTIEASLSSETPVFRPGLGREILSHAAGAIDLSRAPIPVLTSHKQDETPVGVVENLRVIGGKLRGTLRLGNSQRAKEVWEDIKAGVLRNISVGYSIIKGAAKGDDYIVSLWQLLEVSLVAVPADPTVGIGRSFVGERTMEHNQDDITELEPHLTRSQRRAALRGEEDVRLAREEERYRATEIRAIGRQFDMNDFADQAIENGTSVDAFRLWTLEKLKPTSHLRLAESPEIGMSYREASQFSFVKLIRASIDPAYGQRHCGLEMEASRAVAQKLGREPQGLFVPSEVLLARDLTVGAPTSGGYLRPTDHYAEGFIDILRKATHVINLGATELNDLRGDVSIPSQTGSATGYWLEEGQAPVESNLTFGQVLIKPKTVGGSVDYSRKMMLQASPDIERLVRRDLAGMLSVEVDRVAINGSGSGAEPLGILNASGVSSIPIGANGGVPTWSHMLQLEEALAISNADVGSIGYLTNPKVRRKLKESTKVSADAGAGFIWEASPGDALGFGRVNGYRAAASNNVPNTLTKGTSNGVCSAIILGNWANLVIGRWGALDILVDPYALGTSGGVRVVALLDCDIALRRTASFAVIKDALTA